MLNDIIKRVKESVMNEALIIKSVFIAMTLWTLSIVLLWFRPRIEIFWKFIATFIFIFYLWFFKSELISGFETFISSWYISLLNFFVEGVTVAFVNLFFLWPFLLIFIFYKADDMGAERLLKFISILTLVLWIIFVVYMYFHTGIDKFLFENLKKMIPHAK